jgi:hypothetical protein
MRLLLQLGLHSGLQLLLTLQLLGMQLLHLGLQQLLGMQQLLLLQLQGMHMPQLGPHLSLQLLGMLLLLLQLRMPLGPSLSSSLAQQTLLVLPAHLHRQQLLLLLLAAALRRNQQLTYSNTRGLMHGVAGHLYRFSAATMLCN